MSKGNISRGYQKTLVSGENIKTIGGKSILGAGDLGLVQWILIGQNSITEDGTYDALSLADMSNRFFSAYSKFKVVCDFDVIDAYPSSEGNNFTAALYFLQGSSLAYKLYYSYSGSDTTKIVRNPNKPSGMKDFHCEFVIERWVSGVDENNNIVYGNGTSTTLLPLSYSEASLQYRSVAGGSNPGIFGSGATAGGINGIRLATLSGAQYIKKGRIMLFGMNN